MTPRRLVPVIALGLLACVLLPAPVYADEGHSHDAAPTSANPNAPQRLPDGSVFLPKPAQHQMGVRTLPVQAGQLARTHELQGRVTLDPNAGGRVQPTTPGRLVPGPRGLPTVGQAVRRGEVLAYVEPSAAPIERAGQAAQIAELRATQALAEKRLARLRELADTVPRKEIEAAEAEAASADARARALGSGLSSREALVAPITGTIASAQGVAGQVVDARELLYEVVDPARLQIEALAFDAGLAADIGSASLAVGGERVPLAFLGAARSLREQALPLSFRAQSAALSRLAVGQPVRVYVAERATLDGFAVPASAVMKDAANRDTVWVKTAPERFEPRPVIVQPLDGVRVAITRGLADGDRVATGGAALIQQIR